MKENKTYTQEEAVEIMALMFAVDAYKKITGKDLLDDEDKMLLTHLKIFSDLSNDTLKDAAELMEVGQKRICEMANDVGIYCAIMS